MKVSLSTILLITFAALSSVVEAARLGQKAVVDDGRRMNSSRVETRQKLQALLQKRLATDWEKTVPNPFSAKKTTSSGGQRHILQDEEADAAAAAPDGRTVIVECLERPLFYCSTCADSLQAEQDAVLAAIVAQYPEARLVSATKSLINAIFVELPLSDNNASAEDAALRQIEGVKDVTPHGSLQMDVIGAVESIGVYQAREQFCATGRDVRVAVLDGGIDYTHKAMGGSGTLEDYRAAYGASGRSQENRQRDGLFPTNVVVDGYDFIGEFNSVPVSDPDPIDNFGHGTAVADAIRSVAPGAKLVALKVCSTGMACPVFSIIQGLEYALDPNQDGEVDDKVDIINLSLGIPFVSPFYNFVARALESAFALGVLPVVAAGNSGNIPYIIGGLSGSPNSISVGATGHPDSIDAGVMADYSSRGPGENNMMKPDIVAPSGLTLAAAGTGFLRYRSIQGTSFSAPLVAGAAAVVMERCPDCSPFAIKSLLMNNANRRIRYHSSSLALSPSTMSGAGELQIDKTLEADFWAYSVEDVQPSMSLGLINAASDITVRKTIKIVNLSSKAQTLLATYELRDPFSPYADALTVELSTPRVELNSECNSEAIVEVLFKIDASKAPPNVMTSTGWAGFDPRRLDVNEFGGHVIISSESTNKDISLPFVGIIRRASDVAIEDPVIRDLSTEGPTSVNLNLVNNGAGTAQIDAFELLVVSGDDIESLFGDPVAPNDIRYVGYRVLPVGKQGCTHLVEFAFNTWERKNGRLVGEIYGVEIDTDGDGEGDVFLYNLGLGRENIVIKFGENEETCTGLPPDHGTSSATTVLRACSEDLGIEDFEGRLGLRFEAITITDDMVIVSTDVPGETFTPVAFPKPRLSAPSYDVYPGDVLETLEVDGSGDDSRGFIQKSLGLMLVTNSYRTSNSTGASTPSTEAAIMLQDGYNFNRLPREITTDVLEFPQAENLVGPDCSWKEVDPACDGTVVGNQDDDNMDIDIADTLESPILEGDSILNPVLPMTVKLTQNQNSEQSSFLVSCAPVVVPRANVPTRAPTTAPLPTTSSPTVRPVAATASPIFIPVDPPGFGPPSSGSAPISVVVASEEAPTPGRGTGTDSFSIEVTPEEEAVAETVDLEAETSGASGIWSRLLTTSTAVGFLLAWRL